MSELFTQNYSDKPLFHTDTDISESLHNQVDEASNGEELLDNTEKQAESLLSNDDCNGVQREHNKKLNNGLPILHKVPSK